jgi:peptidoglycan/xylan/chitin deacetylase (PgdA/CDA1 family)
MEPEDVAVLLTGKGIDIGAHSQTHQPLTTLSVPERRQEIEGCRDACEALIGKSITGFAYPHGDLDQVTKELVRDSGFQWACSTRNAAVDPTYFDMFDLPRLQVLNWTVQEFQDVLAATRSDS